MKLISCECCGIVLDTDRIYKPKLCREDQTTIIEQNVGWDGEEFLEAINCPGCGSKIFYHNGDETE